MNTPPEFAKNTLEASLAQRDLEMLEVLGRSPDISQRNLARETSMALGLANSCVKRLVRKGWVKIQEAPGRRYLYYITPNGLSEKTRLTYEYVRYSVQYYALARQRCRALFQQLAAEGVRRLAFLGKSDLAEIAFLSLQEFPLEFVALYDNPASADDAFFGRQVRQISELPKGAPKGFDALIYTRLQPPDKERELAGVPFREIL